MRHPGTPPQHSQIARLSFRFYAQLNDFLPAERRGATFAHAVSGPASVKDAIEALGVPHPEVDLILVNSEPAGFGHIVRDGDWISVYPTFGSLDVPASARVGTSPPDPVRFVADVHLGKLARSLRLAGFDVAVIDDDAKLAQASASGGRVALTRDVGLLKRAIIRWGHWLRSTDPRVQFVEVLQRFALGERVAPFTRCLQCNTELVRALRGEVIEDIPARVAERNDDFRRCAGCGRVYWRGSHYERLREYLSAAVEQARGTRRVELPPSSYR